MTRSTVLPANKVGPYMGLEEEEEERDALHSWGRARDTTGETREGCPRIPGFQVFFIRPGGTLDEAQQDAEGSPEGEASGCSG